MRPWQAAYPRVLEKFSQLGYTDKELQAGSWRGRGDSSDRTAGQTIPNSPRLRKVLAHKQSHMGEMLVYSLHGSFGHGCLTRTPLFRVIQKVAFPVVLVSSLQKQLPRKGVPLLWSLTIFPLRGFGFHQKQASPSPQRVRMPFASRVTERGLDMGQVISWPDAKSTYLELIQPRATLRESHSCSRGGWNVGQITGILLAGSE